MNYIWSSGIRWKMFYRKAIKEMEWLDLESNWQAWIGLEKKEKMLTITSVLLTSTIYSCPAAQGRAANVLALGLSPSTIILGPA